MSNQSLLVKELDELYKLTDAGVKSGAMYTTIRKWMAYTLKFIAGGGSLAIATGLSPEMHQGIGIAILVAVFIDTISSNHKKLIAEVEAGYAYRSLKSRVKWSYNREASPLFILAKGDDKSAEEKLDKLMSQAHLDLSTGIEKIRSKLEKADIEALKSLSLEQEKTDNH